MDEESSPVSRIEQQLPSLASPKTDMLLPILTNDRREIALPKVTKSRTLEFDASRAQP
jgi:hypothetical protein